MKNYLFPILAMVFVSFSCGQNQESGYGYDQPATEAYEYEDKGDYEQTGRTTTAEDQPGSSMEEQTMPDRKIIKTANYRMRVADLQESKTRVEALVGQYGGIHYFHGSFQRQLRTQ